MPNDHTGFHPWLLVLQLLVLGENGVSCSSLSLSPFFSLLSFEAGIDIVVLSLKELVAYSLFSSQSLTA